MMVCFLFPAFAVQGQTQSNSELISSLLKQMVDSVAVVFQPMESTAVAVTSAPGSADWSWMVEKEITGALHEKGAVVYRQEQPVDSLKTFMRLYYVPVNLQIRYKPVSIFKGAVRRNIHLELFLRISDESSKVLFSQTLRHESRDIIHRKEIRRVEHPALPFTVGKTEGAGPRRFLEPLWVTIVTGGIIYLFYSFRTQS